MKRIRSILRGREGMTLVELVVGAGLLCLVIGVFSASLRPAAEVSHRTQELNSAELIADDLLETVRSKVETATDYIKCYDNGTVRPKARRSSLAMRPNRDITRQNC